MLFGKNKKKEIQNGDLYLAKNIYLKQPKLQNGNRFIRCILRAFLIFLLVFGAIGGFLSAFRVKYNMPLVLISFMLLSIYFSFLYATSKMLYRDLGYIAFFVLFVGAIYRFHLDANSGFYFIVNTILKEAQLFFKLSGIREYEVQIEDSYQTVAIVAIFLGMIMIILLNIWLHATMSLFWAMFLTLPMLVVPIYMKLPIEMIYLWALVIGFSMILVYKANGHYVVYIQNPVFRVKGNRKKKLLYTQDAEVFGQLILVSVVLTGMLLLILNLVFSSKNFERRFRTDYLHDATKESIGNFILLGFDSLYNRYSSTGGMSGGMLGGIANVRPDYQTDLVVDFTPYSTEPIYLKAYTGVEYADNCWRNIRADYMDSVSEQQGETESLTVAGSSCMDESLYKEAMDLKGNNGKDTHYAVGKMDIYNVAADEDYWYYPYYTELEADVYEKMELGEGLARGQEKTYTYYPKIEWEDSLLSTPSSKKKSVNPVYLEVPERNKEIIEKECERIGLSKDMTQEEIVNRIVQYFQDNIPYTLKPGATPRNQDVINYFLTKNRKGYCAHFASAATLLFRQMGIPARYVEGYAISLENVLLAEQNEEKKYADYYEGYSAIGESAVVSVEVSDAMAHAWVERYVEGFGWKVVEVTPSSSEVDEDIDDFWSNFVNAFNNRTEDGINRPLRERGTFSLRQFVGLLYILLAVFGGAMLCVLGRVGLRKWKQYQIFHQVDRREVCIAYYADLCEMLRFVKTDFASCKTHQEQLKYIENVYEKEIDVIAISTCLEKISYSNHKVEEEQIRCYIAWLKQLRKQVFKKASFWQRCRLFMR